MSSVLLGYLIGAIPFGAIISRFHRIDIQKVGSGNIGATNVFRNLGPVAGITVFILDAAKGAVPIYLAQLLLPQALSYKYWIFVLVGAAAIMGHMYPVYLRFKGGKGGATGLGVLMGLMPDISLIALVAFLIVLFISRFVSVSTITAAVAVLVAIWLTSKPGEYLIVTIIIVIFIIYKHIPNIKRLLSGTEPKIGKREKKK